MGLREWWKKQQAPGVEPSPEHEVKGVSSPIENVKSSKDVDALVQALEDPDVEIRRGAVQALGEVGDERAVAPLITALQDPELEVKAESALGELGAPAVEPLISLIRERGKATRAGGALRRITDPDAVRPLLAALAEDDSSVRANATCALGEIGDPGAVPPLCEALQDPERLVADWSAEALAKLGDDRAVEPLVETLRARFSRAAAKALDDLGWTPADDTERAVHLLAQQDFRAIRELGEAAFEPLVTFLRSSETRTGHGVGGGPAFDDTDVQARNRERAATALGEIGDARAIGPLVWLLREGARLDRPDLGDAAAAALAKLGEPATEPLRAILVNPNEGWSLRTRAADALGAIGDPRVVPQLTTIASSDEDRSVRAHAANALERIDAASRTADVVISRRNIRPSNIAAYLAMDVGDLTHTMPQRTYQIAKGWADRDTPGPLQKDEVDEVTHFAGELGPATLERFGYDLVWQPDGYDILKKRRPQNAADEGR